MISTTDVSTGVSVYAWGMMELLLVAILWGGTNPFLNRARAAQSEAATETDSKAATAINKRAKAESTNQNANNVDGQPLPSPSLVSLLLTPSFLVPFLLNQLGSLLYLHSLRVLALNLAVPLANAATVGVTAVVGAWIGEKQRLNAAVWLGLCLMVCGISLCVISQHQQEQDQAHEALVT